MCALLNDIAIPQHQNPVSILDCGQTVGDHERGSALHQFVHRFLDQDFRTRIDRTGGFVQNQDGGVCQNCTCNCEQLFLTSRDVAGILVEHHVIAAWQCACEVIGVCQICGAFNLFICSILATIANVFTDGAIEQPGILQHHGKLAAQVSPGEVLDIDAIHQNLAAVDIVKAHQQFHQRGLACAGRSHNCHLLTRFHLDRKIVDHRVVGVVAEPNVLEFDSAFHVVQVDRVFRIGRLFRFVQEFEDTF